MKIRRILIAALALLSTARAVDPIINLDATNKVVGPLGTWSQTAPVTSAGNFTSAGGLTPSVSSVSLPSGGTVKAVLLTGSLSNYVGPVAPAAVTGSNSPRTVEAWVRNAAVAAEETIISWGRRDTIASNTLNSSFNYGTSGTFGAVNHTGTGGGTNSGVGWGTVPTADIWHYLVYTNDGTTDRVYVDGLETNSKAVTLATASRNAGNTADIFFRLGGQSEAAGSVTSTAAYCGSMYYGRVRVLGELLSPAQIAANYTTEGPTFGRGQPTINSFTSSAGLSVPSGTPVALSWNVTGATLGVSINNGAPAISGVTGTTVVFPTTTTTYTLTATNAVGSATTTRTVTIAPYVSPLKNRYSFSGLSGALASGTVITDSVGSANATLLGAGATGDSSQVLLPGGSKDTQAYIDLPNSVMTGMTNVTLEGWMTVTASRNWSRIFDFGTGTVGELTAPGGTADGTQYLMLSAQIGADLNTQRLSFKVGTEQAVDIGFATPVGTQTHFAYVYDTTGNGGAPQVKYYRNGVLIGTLNTTYQLSQVSFVNNWLGRSNWTGDQNTQGNYNEFRIWSTPLSASEIAANVAAGPDSVATGPAITAFFAQPATIFDGESTTLYWGTSNSVAPLTGSISPDVGATATANGSVVVTPAGIGSVPYTYTATNPDGSRSVTANVTVISGAPTVVGASLSIFQDSSTPVTLTATDPNTPLGSLSYSYTTPANGTLTGTAPNLTFTPVGGFVGTTSFVFTASDGTHTSNSANILIYVNSTRPVANNVTISTAYQTAVPATLVATDPNTPVGSLTYSNSTPAHGTLSGTAPNFTYTPAMGYYGPDSFQFAAADATLTSNIGTVSITVLPPPLPPTNLLSNDTVIRTTAGNGSFITYLQPVDPNPTDSFTLTLVAGVGDTHNGFFTINGTQLMSAHDFSGDLGLTISVRIRVTDNTGAFFEKVLTFPVAAPDLHVKVNEIHYNPGRNTQLTEFIELYNPTAAAVDMSGWRFDSGVNYIFPSGTSIAAGGYLVIAADPSTMSALYGVTAIGPWTGGLDSNGENIVLRDQSGNKVDGAEYGITSPWPAPSNGDGPTLELVNPAFDNDNGGNWRASIGVPAVVNYLAAGSAGWSYRKGTSEASSPMSDWHAETFTQDGTWLTGTMPIGVLYQNSGASLTTNMETGVTLGTQLPDMATYVGSGANSGANYTVNYRTVYFRKSFTVAGTIPKNLLLRVMHNDAAIVWINGVEIIRFGFPPAAVGDALYNTTAVYERGNDPWSELVIANAESLLHAGANTIAIHGIAKTPQTRSLQDDVANYNVFDFSVDASLTNVPDPLGTPGAQNSVFAANIGPVIRSIDHSPKAPLSTQPLIVSAKVSAPQGIASVSLSYQLVAPGNFIPSTLPLSNAAIIANSNQALPANPAFELPANWTNIAMVDDGSIGGDKAGDGTYTAVIPAQPNRTLIRYRILATDLTALNTRVPATDDPRKNFAAFVYDGVPGYSTFSAAAINSLPAYHWLTRASDFSTLLAYNVGEQFTNLSPELSILLARKFENFEGALVVGNDVIDHTLVRLRGGNSRYLGAGKRHFRFVFPNGTPLQATDEAGRKYARPWKQMLFNKLFGNKGHYDFGLPYEIGGKMWSLSGVPIPESHWVGFRVIRDANATHATLGDFWGLYQALELPDGPDFLAARNLERGNFYKMSDWMQNGELSTRSQAPRGVDYAEDFDNIRYNIHQTTSDSYMEQYVNMPLYYKYNAVQEAIRHYDIFVEPTGRHRVKNLIWYFQPVAGNPLGKLWFMPYDWDASFGPNWNNGWDFVHNAMYDHYDIVDSPTWALPKQTPRTAMNIAHRNAIRELRDLLFYRDTVTNRGPVDDIMDDAAAKLSQFYLADIARWPAPGAQINYAGGSPAKIADMKAFLFTGWTDTAGNNDPAVGAGGRAAYLDSISDAIDAGLLPTKPIIGNASALGNPVDAIVLTTTPFSDPQGTGTFGGIQWRIGEITDNTAPAYDATAERIYEMAEVWNSGDLPAFSATIAVPGNVLKIGHTYRARVRHKDSTGRFCHWSSPIAFTPSTANYLQVLKDNLMVTEVMYHPSGPSPAESAFPNNWLEDDFEYIELQNISNALTLDLTNVSLDQGVNYQFSTGTITTLAPGARMLVVRNINAFNFRYGAGKPITGAWNTGDRLSNNGEKVRIIFGATTADPIKEFSYKTIAPWPAGADVEGYSMVLINPTLAPNHALGTSWRASVRLNGTPGENGTLFSDWTASNAVSGPLTDTDGDGIVNQIEYAFGGNPNANTQSPLPTRAVQNITVSGTPADYFTLTFRRYPAAEDLTYSVEFTSDLNATWTASGTLTNSVPMGDGSVLETWRTANPMNSGPKQFGRVKVVKP